MYFLSNSNENMNLLHCFVVDLSSIKHLAKKIWSPYRYTP